MTRSRFSTESAAPSQDGYRFPLLLRACSSRRSKCSARKNRGTASPFCRLPRSNRNDQEENEAPAVLEWFSRTHEVSYAFKSCCRIAGPSDRDLRTCSGRRCPARDERRTGAVYFPDPVAENGQALLPRLSHGRDQPDLHLRHARQPASGTALAYAPD